MTASTKSTVGLLAAAFTVLSLQGCAGDQDELQQWMEQQRREVKPSVEPLSAPKKFIPQSYVALSSVEPFSTQKLTVALKQEARQPNSLLAAEINRRKEALEAYPIDTCRWSARRAAAGRMRSSVSTTCFTRSSRATIRTTEDQ
jgi:type IV pilus assembly protein PilP